MTVEKHPFEPFLPAGAKVLMLGSFPPPAKRWCMEFYYPNFGNDMWRIVGIIFFGDREHFVTVKDGRKVFDKDGIAGFCRRTGIAMYDTACEVVRLRDNASDKFLEVARATDIMGLLGKIPECGAVVTTGQKAAEVLAGTFGCAVPPMGGSVDVSVEDSGKVRTFKLFRMPSSSRAYPLSLDRKAEAYRRVFESMGML